MSKKTRAQRDRYSTYKSAAQQVFHDKDMIIARPAEMAYDEYKIMQRIQNRVLRIIFRKPAPRRPTIPQRLGYNLHPQLNLKDGKKVDQKD